MPSEIELSQILCGMLCSTAEEIATYLVIPRNGLKEILNNNYDDFEIVCLLLDFISKACSSSYNACDEYIRTIVLSSSFWLKVIPTLLSSSSLVNDKFLNSLLSAIKIIYDVTSFDAINYLEDISSSAVDEVKKIMYSELNVLQNKTQMNKWTISIDNEMDNYRCNEKIFPDNSDFDKAYPPFIYENVLKESYGNTNNYLDTYFYLIKESVVRYYRNIINEYWERKSKEIHLCHNEVIIKKLLFQSDGIHINLLLPVSKDFQRESRIIPGLQLCLSINNFVTMDFVTVTTMQNLKSGDLLLQVKVINYFSFSLQEGKKCVLVESEEYSNIHTQILKILKNKKIVPLYKYIVNTEKSFEPPIYINQMDKSLWFKTDETEQKNQKIRKLEYCLQAANSFSIDSDYINDVGKILQQQLSLVKTSKKASKALCLNLLKIFDQYIIENKISKFSVLVICNTNRMLEELSAQIFDFSKNPFVLHDKSILKKLNYTEELESMASNYGNNIKLILDEIELYNKDFFKLIEKLRSSKEKSFKSFHSIADKIFEWLCLTPENHSCYQETSEFSMYYKDITMKYSNSTAKYSNEFFECIIFNMFKVKDEMASSEVEKISDIWSLDLTKRWNLLRYWKNCVQDNLRKNFNMQKKNYHQIIDVLNDLSVKSDWINLEKASVICATADTAIKKSDSLSKLKPSIIIVLEANEIAEAHLIPSLNSDLQHLILIGTTKEPCLINKELDKTVSLYERLLNNNMPFFNLKEIKLQSFEKIKNNLYQKDDSCKQYFEPCQLSLGCGHTVTTVCRDQNKIECQKLVTIVLACDHKVEVTCSQQHKTNIVCRKTKKVLLPCNHEVDIHCNELQKKREDYFQNGCYQNCSITLDCGHLCKGKCSNCVTLGIHKGCKEKCNMCLSCGHSCVGLCGAPCPPCSFLCEWDCSHTVCGKVCGEICSSCCKPCNWICPHFTCNKLCYEECDRPNCKKTCSVLLKCGHSCVGLCGEKCPNLCAICNIDRYEELYVPECKQIIELNCGHMFNTISIISALDDLIEHNMRPTCPLCNVPIKNSGYLGKYVKLWWFSNVEKKSVINNKLELAIKNILYDTKIIATQHYSKTVDAIVYSMKKKFNLSVYVLARNHIAFIVHLKDIITIVSGLEKLKPEHYELINKAQKLIIWIEKEWMETNFRQLESISWQVQRMNLLSILYKRLQGMKRFLKPKVISIDFQRHEKAVKLLQKIKTYNNEHHETLKKIFKNFETDKELNSIFFNRILPISKEKYHKLLKGNITDNDINWKVVQNEYVN